MARKIGQGGMGAVYEAVDTRLRSAVALKEMLVSSERLDRAFEREAQLLANLRHPALPKVIDYFSEAGARFLVMEYIPGDDLGELMQKDVGPFPVADVLHWADLLLDALDYLHSQSPPVIHRDIKPQNLKFTLRGEIILLDFGLAKGAIAQGAQFATNRSILGYTPQYAPLEQIKGAGTDTRSDLYSLAATLYHLLTGEPPANALDRASELINRKPDPLVPAHHINPQVPADVSLLLAQALALDPSRRFKSAAAMRAAINASRLPQSNSNVTTRSNEANLRREQQPGEQQPANTPLTHAGASAATSLAAQRTTAPESGTGQQAGSAMGRSISINSTQQSRGMKQWLIFSGIAVPLIVVGVLVFVLVRARESERTLATAARNDSSSAPAASPVVPTALTQSPNDEARAGADTYKILSAFVERESENKLAVQMMIRVTSMAEYSSSVFKDSFRLIADGTPIAPSNYPSEIIPAYSAKEVNVNFEIPDNVKSLELQVGKEGEKTNRMVFNTAALLNQTKRPAPSPSARQYPVRLDAGAEAKAEGNTYRILSAELDRHSDGLMAVKLKMRVTNEGQYAINVYENFFRLIADGSPRAPEKSPNEVLAVGASTDVDVMFVINESSNSIELQVGQAGKNTTRMPLALPQKN